MLISALYTSAFFKTGKNQPEFDKYVLQQFEKNSPVIQAQQFVPVGGALGGGKKGKVFSVVANEGGYSPNRELFQADVTANVVGSTPATIFMGNNSEKVVVDAQEVVIFGAGERDTQLSAALARLYKTFVFKLFNADTDNVDITDLLNDAQTTKKYDFEGYAKYFGTYTGQVASDELVLPDVIANPNIKEVANVYLNDVMSLVSVNGIGAQMIYTSRSGKVILAAIESAKAAYTGEYKFTQNVATYQGLPIIEIPDASIPAAWKLRGEFVMFVNQDAQAGCRIMVPTNGGLIVTHDDAKKGFTTEIPMDMTFAPVLINGKAASLCFLKASGPATINKTSLGAVIVRGQALAEADYTAATWAPFETALAAAIVVMGSATATQIQVIAATATLQAAIDGLVLDTSVPENP